MKYLAIALLSLFSAVSAYAAKQYQVEMIVFSQLNQQALTSESWPPIEPFQLPDTSYISLNGSQQAQADTNNNFELLPPWQLKLNTLAKRLAKDPHYQVLMHIGWIEMVPAPKAAKPIYISNSNNASPIDIKGLMTLNVDRFFNAYFNVNFSVPMTLINQYGNDSNFNNILGGDMRFHLLQSRRLRSNELNYIDNPLFGILLEIFPATTSAATTT